MSERNLNKSPKSLIAALMLSSAVIIAPVGFSAAAFAQSTPKHHFDMTLKTIDKGVAEIGKSFGWRIVYAFELPQLTADLRIQGDYTIEEALSQLLQGTGIKFKISSDKSIILLDPAAKSAEVNLLDPIVVQSKGGNSNSTIDTLPEEYAGGLIARGGRVGVLGNKDLMNTPFNTTSYTNKKIANQQATTVADVVKQEPSVRVSSSAGGMLDAYYIRGLPLNIGNSSDIAYDGTFGVTPSYRVISDMVERVEVVKGPTALLYGMSPNSAVGGTINVVPKRAKDEDLTEVKGTFGRGTQVGLHTDFSRRFGENDAFGLRLNAGVSDGDTPLDNQTRTARLGAAAFDYKGDDLRITFDLNNQREDFDAPYREVRFAAAAPIPDAPNGARNITQKWEWSETEDTTALLRSEYDLSENVMIFGGFGGGTSSVNRLFGYPIIQNAAGDTTDTPSRYVFESTRFSAEAGARGQFETGEIAHNMAFQYNFYNERLENGSVNGTSLTSNIYNPVNQPSQSIAKAANIATRSKSTLSGFALADTLSAWDEMVQLTLGVRHQTVKTDNFDAKGVASNSYDEEETSPMAGLVVRPIEPLSVYANYAEGLSKGDIAPSTASNAGEAMSPYVTEQYEAGVKLDYGTIGGTASVFQITKPFGQLSSGTYKSDGEQRNRGFEFSVFGELTPQVRIVAGAMLLDAEMTSTNSATTQGKRPVGVPEFQSNVTLEWSPETLAGLTLGGTVVHTGEQYVDTANTKSIDGWTTLDLAASYDVTFGETPLTVRGGVDNVFDAEYWSGVNSWSMVSTGAPRTFLVSLSAKF